MAPALARPDFIWLRMTLFDFALPHLTPSGSIWPSYLIHFTRIESASWQTDQSVIWHEYVTTSVCRWQSTFAKLLRSQELL